MKRSSLLGIAIVATLAAAGANAQEQVQEHYGAPGAAQQTAGTTQATSATTGRENSARDTQMADSSSGYSSGNANGSGDSNARTQFDQSSTGSNYNSGSDAEARGDTRDSNYDATSASTSDYGQSESSSSRASDSNASNSNMDQSKSNSSMPSNRVAAASGTQSGASGSAPVVMLLVPVEMQTQSSASSHGCWARLYGQDQMKGDTLTLVGPVDMMNMTGPFGIDWGQKVSSIEAGPQAKLTLYSGSGFKNRAATVEAGKRVGNVEDSLGQGQQINSMRISCRQNQG